MRLQRKAVAIIVAVSIATGVAAPAFSATKKPTIEEINAAKKAEAAKKAAADAQAKTLNKAKDSLRTLTAKPMRRRPNTTQRLQNSAVQLILQMQRQRMHKLPQLQ